MASTKPTEANPTENRAVPAADSDPLAEIELGALKELKILRDQQAVVEGRLEELEKHRGSTSPLVFERVMHDYRSQIGALDERAEPLRCSVRAEFAKLERLVDRLHEDEQAVRSSREELVLRHQVGEFSKEEFDSRIACVEQQMARAAKRVERGTQLRHHFVAAFRSEDELTLGEPPPLAPAPTAATVATPQVPASPGEPEEQIGGTLIIPSQELGATMMVDPARLVLVGEGEEPEIHSLRLDVTLLGRDSGCHIRIKSKTVSRRHAEIRLEAQGFTVHDLGSENGTYLNGERITVAVAVLKHGDKVRFGDSEFVFELS